MNEQRVRDERLAQLAGVHSPAGVRPDYLVYDLSKDLLNARAENAKLREAVRALREALTEVRPSFGAVGYAMTGRVLAATAWVEDEK